MQPNLVELYKARDFPIFQNKVFSSETEARKCARGDITLVQDLKTGLVYNLTFQPELMQYDTNYQNEQSHSNAFRKHFIRVAEIIHRHFTGMSLLEIGCGKGYFPNFYKIRVIVCLAWILPMRVKTHLLFVHTIQASWE